MTDLDRALADFEAPPPRPGFHDELWEKLAHSQRRAAQTWRAIAVAATAVAFAATSAAGVLAFSSGTNATRTLDQTLECPVPDRGGVNLLNLFARVSGAPAARINGYRIPQPATVEVDAGLTVIYSPSPHGAPVPHLVKTIYAGASPALTGGYTFNESVCKTAKAIPLAPNGLSDHKVFAGSHGSGTAEECWLAPVATVRLRVTIGSSGKPTGAKLAVRSGRKRHPIAYVEWKPSLVKEWLAPSCHETQ